MPADDSIIVDRAGKFLLAFRSREKQEDADWISCRIIISDKGIAVIGKGGKRIIPYSSIRTLGHNYNINKNVLEVDDYIGIGFSDDKGDHIILLSGNSEPLEIIYGVYQALLDHEGVLVKHPAVQGGVVQDEEWKTGQLKIFHDIEDAPLEEGSVIVASPDGMYIDIEIENVSGFKNATQEVKDEERSVLKVSHSERGSNVETHLAGGARSLKFVQSLLERSIALEDVVEDLTDDQKQVIMALHSGVPFYDIPDFVGMTYEEVMDIFESLEEDSVLTEVRERKEVSITARGRRIAAGAMESE